MLEQKRVAIYLRISQEDLDMREGAVDGYVDKGESNSISNQRKLLQEYIVKNNEFSKMDIIEYLDDGYSGTNFDRPGFINMMKDIETGRIDCIFVKDFSRFGRNFLQVGDYLEQFLPLHGVRFVSVNDSYDSKLISGYTGGIDVAFKNLIYDYYSKDLSHKVKSAVKTRQIRGEYISAYAFFGYEKNKKDRHKLVIDEDAAKIVRMIFELAIEKKSTLEIARILNDKNILTPAKYKSSKGINRYKVGEMSVWTQAMVNKVLRDTRYNGDMVSNKRIHNEIAKDATMKISMNDWIIKKGTHEGIISWEEFDKANRIMQVFKEKATVAKGSARRNGIWYCGYCGHKLVDSGTVGAYYYCKTGKNANFVGCKDIVISKEDLEYALYEMIKARVSLLCTKEHILQTEQRKRGLVQDNTDLFLGILQEISKVEKLRMGLYEQYKQGKFSKEEFITRREKYSEQIAGLEEKKAKSEKVKGQQESADEMLKRVGENIEHFKNMKQVDVDYINGLIERVAVYKDDRIEVRWNVRED